MKFSARPLEVDGKWRVEVTMGTTVQCIGKMMEPPLFKWLEFDDKQGAIDKINNDDRLKLNCDQPKTNLI